MTTHDTVRNLFSILELVAVVWFLYEISIESEDTLIHKIYAELYDIHVLGTRKWT